MTICQKCDALFGYTPEEREALKQICHYNKKHRTEGAIFYLRIANDLVTRMEEQNANWAEMSGYNKAVVALVQMEKYETATKLYALFVFGNVKKFWPDCQDYYYLKNKDLPLDQLIKKP